MTRRGVEAVDGEGGDAGEHGGHARRRSCARLQHVICAESCAARARIAASQSRDDRAQDRHRPVSVVHATRLASPSCPPTCATTSAASARTLAARPPRAARLRARRAQPPHALRRARPRSCFDGDALVFVEVKTRRRGARTQPVGGAATSASAGRSAGWPPPASPRPPTARAPPELRFDAIGVVIDARGRARAPRPPRGARSDGAVYERELLVRRATGTTSGAAARRRALDRRAVLGRRVADVRRRTPSRGAAASARCMKRSRVTLAMIEAAAIAALVASPSTIGALLVARSRGTAKPSRQAQAARRRATRRRARRAARRGSSCAGRARRSRARSARRRRPRAARAARAGRAPRAPPRCAAWSR